MSASRFSGFLCFMPGMCNQGFIFFEKVKEKLGSSDDYQAFLKCLHIYSNGIIKRNDLQNLVCLTPSSAVIQIFKIT